MSLLKQIFLSVAVIVFAALAWFAFEHRDLILGDGEAATADDSASAPPGRNSAAGAPTGRPTGPGGFSAGGSPGGGNRGGFGVAAPVTTAAVEIDRTGADVRAIGTLAASDAVTLYSEVTAIVTEVAVKPGQKVAAGDVIVRIGDADQQVAVEKARIGLANATAAGERTEQLAKTSNATASALSDARAAEQDAAIDLKSAELELAKRTLKAPFAGTVGLLTVAVGDLVNSQKPITTLDDVSTLSVAFDVPQRVVLLVAIGQDVKATSEWAPGRTFLGTITAIDSRVDPEARTLKVEATLPNEGDVLKPGMAIAIEMSFTGEPRPSVPSLAVQWDRKGSFVWKLDGHVVHRVPVQVIARHSGAVAVAGDLKQGDQVVVEGVLRLREGATVAHAGSDAPEKPGAGDEPSTGKPVASEGAPLDKKPERGGPGAAVAAPKS